MTEILTFFRTDEDKLLTVETDKLKELDTKLEEFEGQLNQRSRQENHRIRGEMDVLKKEGYKVKSSKKNSIRRLLTNIKIQSVVNKLENGMSKIENEIDDLKKRIPFTVRPTQLLGTDRNRNQYWFFSDEPDCVYIRMYNSNEKIPDAWRCLKSQATVEACLKTLNQKAVREGQLYRKLNKILSGEHLEYEEKRKTLEDPAPTPPNLAMDYLTQVKEYESMYQPKKHSRKINTRRTDTTFQTLHKFRERCASVDPLTRNSCKFMIEILIELETEFTEYLALRTSRWVSKYSTHFRQLFSPKQSDFGTAFFHKFSNFF